MHVVVAANRWAEIRPALLDNLGTRLELRLHDAIDSLVSRKAAAVAARRRPGPRADDGRPALPDRAAARRRRGEDEGTAARSASSRRRGGALDGRAGRADPPAAARARPAPAAAAVAREGVPIGVEERGLDPVWVDFGGPDPHFLVFGDSQTGKSSLLRGLGRGLIAAHEPEELQLVRRRRAALAARPRARRST